MNLSEAQKIIVTECDREKKIALRNLIVIAVVAFIIVVLLVVYALEPLQSTFSKTIDNLENSTNVGAYYKIIFPIIFLSLIAFPLNSLRNVMHRSKQVTAVFTRIKQGKTGEVVDIENAYLTIVPLFIVRLTLDPISYMKVRVDQKEFTLPAPPLVIPHITRALAHVDVGYYEQVIGAIYGENKQEIAIEEQGETNLAPLHTFQAFCRQTFRQQLSTLEKERSKSNKVLYFQVLISLALVGGIIYFSTVNPDFFQDSLNLLMFIGGFFLVMTIGALVYYMGQQNNTPKQQNTRSKDTSSSLQEIKKTVFTKIIHFINPKFQYIEKGHLSLPEILYSDLLKVKQYAVYGGEQFVGYYKGVPFQSCNLTLTYRPNMRSVKEADDTVFTGNYFVARTPQKFAVPIYIHPKKGVFSTVMDNEIATYLHKNGEKVTVNNEAFLQQFTVYSEDETQVRRVLTPVFMERLLAINKRSKGNVYVVLKEHTITIASNTSNITEVGLQAQDALFTKIDQALLDKMYQEIVGQLEIIDNLQIVQ